MSPPALDPRRWFALALLALSEFVVVLDASIVNIALPSIGRGLHFSLANLSWVVNSGARSRGLARPRACCWAVC